MKVLAAFLVLVGLAALWVAPLLSLDARLDDLEQPPAPVVRSQGGGSSRPSSTTTTTTGPSVEVRIEGHCVQTGPREAAEIGEPADPSCGAKR